MFSGNLHLHDVCKDSAHQQPQYYLIVIPAVPLQNGKSLLKPPLRLLQRDCAQKLITDTYTAQPPSQVLESRG